jgi:hypothetical protein
MRILFQFPSPSLHSLLGVLCAISTLAYPSPARGENWKKVSINETSPFEACGVADFNRDGKLDVFCGDSWYAAPNWTRFKVRDVPASRPNPHYYEDFADLPLDVNGDGSPDIVTCNYFGARVGWVENPGKDPAQPWIEHEIDVPGSMETGRLVDLDNNGIPEFLPNPGNIVVCYELQREDSKVTWIRHDVGAEGAGHGIGVGDINLDGRIDILTPKGWYEQPVQWKTERWPFHAEFDLGAAGIMILGGDFDQDQLPEVLFGMGHEFGLFCLKSKKGSDGKYEWNRRVLDESFSQVHTLLLVELDDEPGPELVTGKRVYAHETEPGSTDAPCVYYFRFDKSQGTWVRNTIWEGKGAVNAPDEAEKRWAMQDFEKGSVGTGLDVASGDMDGDGDIDLVCPGKTGLYLLVNPRIQSK